MEPLANRAALLRNAQRAREIMLHESAIDPTDVLSEIPGGHSVLNLEHPTSPRVVAKEVLKSFLVFGPFLLVLLVIGKML